MSTAEIKHITPADYYGDIYVGRNPRWGTVRLALSTPWFSVWLDLSQWQWQDCRRYWPPNEVRHTLLELARDVLRDSVVAPDTAP